MKPKKILNELEINVTDIDGQILDISTIIDGQTWLSCSQAAKRFGLHEGHIRKLCKLKKPPCEISFKIDKFWVIKV